MRKRVHAHTRTRIPPRAPPPLYTLPVHTIHPPTPTPTPSTPSPTPTPVDTPTPAHHNKCGKAYVHLHRTPQEMCVCALVRPCLFCLSLSFDIITCVSSFTLFFERIHLKEQTKSVSLIPESPSAKYSIFPNILVKSSRVLKEFE